MKKNPELPKLGVFVTRVNADGAMDWIVTPITDGVLGSPIKCATIEYLSLGLGKSTDNGIILSGIAIVDWKEALGTLVLSGAKDHHDVTKIPARNILSGIETVL